MEFISLTQVFFSLTLELPGMWQVRRETSATAHEGSGQFPNLSQT